MTYLDTSAIVKRYVVETGSDFVAHLLTHHRPIASSRIGFVEALAAFSRLERAELISPEEHVAMCRNLERHFENYHVVNLTDDVVSLARDLAARHPLKALDLIHLACALNLANRFGDYLCFAGADRQLLRAVEAEGIRVLDVETMSVPMQKTKRNSRRLKHPGTRA